MKIFLNETEVLNLAMYYLDMIQPNPDKVHDIAEKMDMVYNESIDMYEDVEEHSLRRIKNHVNVLKVQVDQYQEQILNMIENSIH
jgi:hypothetical protein